MATPGCSQYCHGSVHLFCENSFADVIGISGVGVLWGGGRLVKMAVINSPDAPKSLSGRVGYATVGVAAGAASLFSIGLYLPLKGAEIVFNFVTQNSMALTAEEVRRLHEEVGAQKTLGFQMSEEHKRVAVLAEQVLPQLVAGIVEETTGSEKELARLREIQPLFSQAQQALETIEGALTTERSSIERENLEFAVKLRVEIQQAAEKERQLSRRVEEIRQQIAEEGTRLGKLQADTDALNRVETLQYGGLKQAADRFTTPKKGATHDGGSTEIPVDA